MGIWYPDSGIKYEQYLIADSFVKDVTGAVRGSGHAIEANISKQTKQLEAKISEQTMDLVASNQQLSSEFGEGFNTMNETLVWGLNALESSFEGGLQEISSSIDSLAADFNYNMGLLINQVSITNNLLSQLIHKLDAIHKTLQNPTLTRAREYFNIGCDRLSKGLLDKALEAFLESENINDADFFTQFHIGTLYLYGIDEDDNVIDLKKAHDHFLLAARYAKAELNVDAHFTKLAAEALLQASIALYAQLGGRSVIDDGSKAKLLEEARRESAEAVKIYPQLYEGIYHIAKYSALLKEPEKSISNLQKAIVADRNYAVKVDIDHAFDPIRSHVIRLLAYMRDTKKNECQDILNQVTPIYEDACTWNMEESDSLRSQFAQCKHDYIQAQKQFNSGTYFGFLDAKSLLVPLINKLPLFKSKREEELYGEVSQLLDSVYSSFPERDQYSASVESDIKRAELLASKAKSQLKQCNYESYKLALSTAQSAYELATSANEKSLEEDAAIRQEQEKLDAKKARQEKEQKALQERSRREKERRKRKWKTMGPFIAVGVVGGAFLASLVDEWFSGVLWIVFALVSISIGYIKASLNNR